MPLTSFSLQFPCPPWLKWRFCTPLLQDLFPWLRWLLWLLYMTRFFQSHTRCGSVHPLLQDCSLGYSDCCDFFVTRFFYSHTSCGSVPLCYKISSHWSQWWSVTTPFVTWYFHSGYSCCKLYPFVTRVLTSVTLMACTSVPDDVLSHNRSVFCPLTRNIFVDVPWNCSWWF